MMFSKSSFIKSKKQKMIQKRQQKEYQKLSEDHEPLSTKKLQARVIVDLLSDKEDSAQLIQIASLSTKKLQTKLEGKKIEVNNKFENSQNMKVEQNKNKANLIKPIPNQTSQNIPAPSISNMEPKFNNFNFDRIKKSTSFIKQAPKPTVLGVEMQVEGLQQVINENNKPINYYKPGQSKQHTISQKFLKARLQKFQSELGSVNKVILQVDGQPEKLLQQQNLVEEVKQLKIKRPSRYFDEQIAEASEQKDSQNEEDDQQVRKKVVKCYRCGQKGHIARLCYQKETLKCVYCLGPHHNSDCNDRLCHRCNQKGHVKQQCKSEKIQCRRCRTYGHIGKNCGKIVMMNFRVQRQKQIREQYDKADLEKLKCLKCNGKKESKGHFNCHQYNKKIPRIYDQPYEIE